MKGKFQGQDEIIINATKEKIWSVLIDGSQIGQMDADCKTYNKQNRMFERCSLL